MKKRHILDEIRRTAQENGGRSLGRLRFETATGIRESDWRGVYWARWNDAVAEAGFAPNALVTAHDEEHLLKKVAELALELGRFPVAMEMRLKRRSDPTFPNDGAIYDRFGNKAEVARKVMEYSAAHPEFATVVALCSPLTTTDVDERQVGVNLPEDLELVHAISTDDAYGIEAHWHERFGEKRRGGEWFELTAEGVRVFKRRRFM